VNTVRFFETDKINPYRPFPLATISADHVDDYIELRRDEGAAENTISKELVVLALR